MKVMNALLDLDFNLSPLACMTSPDGLNKLGHPNIFQTLVGYWIALPIVEA
jgi:hypothetical protein